MKTLLFLLLLVFLPAPAPARLGETVLELKRRYGRPLDVQPAKTSGIERYTFQSPFYAISVTFVDGRSVQEELTRRDGRDFTLEEVRTLLEENAIPGASWRQLRDREWRDASRRATWAQRVLTMVEENARPPSPE